MTQPVLTGPARVDAAQSEDAFWRALAHPLRRRILDLLKQGPRTTGDLAERMSEVSRYAVMQHLGVLEDAGLLLVQRRGRRRFNHVNAAALRRAYDRFVDRYADDLAGELVALDRHLEREGRMDEPSTAETPRVVRIESELHFEAPPERLFRALTDPDDVLRWFPHTYGENRVKRIVMEPRVGGAQYEDWGDGRGHFYGHVTEWDPPYRYAVRSRLHPGTVMDTLAVIEPTETGARVRTSRVIVGPIDDEQERGIRTHGDFARFEDAIRAVVEGDRPARGE
jgi:DNA-binding transcriptional ArsR family regulator